MSARVTRWVVLVALLAPAVAQARSSVTGLQGELLESEEEEGHRDWRLVGTFGLTTGTGTFISNPYSDNPYWANYALLQPSYTFAKLPFKPTLTVSQSLSVEYSGPDLNRAGRRFDYGDTGIGIVAPRIWTEPLTGIAVGANAGFTLPISYGSQFYGRITTPSVGINLSRTLYGFTFLGGVTAAFPIWNRTNQALKNDQLETEDFPIALCRTGEEFCGGGLFSSQWALGMNITALYEISEKFSGGLAFATSFVGRHPAPQDQFTTTAVTPSNRAGDQNTGTLFLAYSIDDNFSLTLSSNTRSFARTADTKSFRFPFFDTISPNSNLTTFAIDLQAIY